MADGDAQRIWYPELIEILRARWHWEMPFPEVIALRDELDAALGKIRAEAAIEMPQIRCRDCYYVGPAPEPHVSVRSLILALKRFEIAAAGPVHALEKGWALYRKEHGLDSYGSGSSDVFCTHPRVR
jgi:hypothetical protein